MVRSFQLYHCENKFSAISWWDQVFSYIMARTNFQLSQGENKFSAVSWWEQVTFWWYGDDFCFVLYQHAELILIVLAHWNNSPHIFSFSLKLHAVRDTASTDFIAFGITRPGLEPRIYYTWDKQANIKQLHRRGGFILLVFAFKIVSDDTANHPIWFHLL